MTDLQQSPVKRRWYQAIGPGLITACVVIGPGSILASSKVGADQGYSMLWVVVTACIFMMFYMQMGARLGVIAKESPAEILTRKAGRWLAVVVGICVFFISTAFQFGNNLGVQSAFDVFLSTNWSIPLVVGFNALSISFLFFFKDFYQALEKLMMCFVGLMLTCFAINLFFAGPEIFPFFRGLLPTAGAFLNIEVLGLVGTTFVVAAAYFQAYLAKQKRWKSTELKTVIIDARVGSVIMAVITIMLMSTAAAVLVGEPLENVEQVAAALEPLFGSKGKILFCVGLFSAAYSSFLVNSMIAGFILSDGLGLGSTANSKGPKILTTVVLLTGMIVALLVKAWGMSAVPAVVAAQAVTVIAGPLIAGVLLWLTNSRDVMGERTNGLVTNIFGVIGFLLLLAIAVYVATVKIPAGLEKIKQQKITTKIRNDAEPATKRLAESEKDLGELRKYLSTESASSLDGEMEKMEALRLKYQELLKARADDLKLVETPICHKRERLQQEIGKTVDDPTEAHRRQREDSDEELATNLADQEEVADLSVEADKRTQRNKDRLLDDKKTKRENPTVVATLNQPILTPCLSFLENDLS